MVKNKINLSLNEPYVRQVYAKEGDSGRLYELDIDPTPTSNGTLRIKRPDGVEVTSPASLGEDITDSGEVVSFDALDEAPMSSLKVGIEPIQDLHGQSNPYPAGGGKNKVQLPDNALHQTDYTVSYYYNIIPTTPYALTADQTYTVSFDYEITGTTTKPNFTVGLGNGTNYATDLVSKNSIDTSGRLEFSFTPTSAQLSTYQYVAFRFPRYSGSKTVSWTISNFQLELGSSATAYAPYSNICPIYGHTEADIYLEPTHDTSADPTATVSLGQTIYGGTLDVVQGKLTVTHGICKVSDFTWNYSTAENHIFRASYSGIISPKLPSSTSLAWDAISDTYLSKSWQAISGADNGRFAISPQSSDRIVIIDYNYTSSATFASEMANSEIVYELATPTVIDLTPQQISTLVGENNLWASCGDVLEVQFAYDGMLSALPSQATEVVGRCIGDVELNGVSTMPFTLVVQKNNQGE